MILPGRPFAPPFSLEAAMRLHHSGTFAADLNYESPLYIRMDKVEREALNSCLWHHETYHLLDTAPRNFRHIRESGVEPIFDFGPREIEKDSATRYARFLENDPDLVFFPISLHVAGDPARNWQLLKTMESAGAKPCPIVCVGDGPDVINYYIHNYTRVSVGGFAGVPTAQARAWLDRFWSIVVDVNGKPTREFHACMLPFELRDYPWTSAHSQWWLHAARGGMILLPKNGQLLDISPISNRVKTAGAHYQTLPQMERHTVDALIKSKGFDPERLGRLLVSRMAWNLMAYTEHLEQNPVPRTFGGAVMELF